MSELTVIYYTSNREDGVFEKNIRHRLLDAVGDIPIISVSQKPLDFGKNICVGDVGVSNQNAHRQFQIGAIEAKTRFVCAAESDFLYPKEYFSYIPERDDVAYRASNLYIAWPKYGAYKKHTSEGATVIGREFAIRSIEKELEGLGMWNNEVETKEKAPITFQRGEYLQFHTTVPVITFKTENNMHSKSPFDRKSRTGSLPYWGGIKDLYKELNNEN